MKNLASNIIKVDKKAIEAYFDKVTELLKLRMYGKPIIFSPSGTGKDGNQGYDAFVPLIDSNMDWKPKKVRSIQPMA